MHGLSLSPLGLAWGLIAYTYLWRQRAELTCRVRSKDPAPEGLCLALGSRAMLTDAHQGGSLRCGYGGLLPA